MDARLHERQGRAVTNFDKTLPALDSDLARELTKDPYAFDFTQLAEAFTESELKAALVANIEKFLLELGNGFAFLGREHRLDVGGTELFTDLLFYHVRLHCYVVVEVKTEPFEPAFLGQLSGYVASANHLLKGPGDGDTVGLLICKSKNRVLARYALEGYNQPLGISDFELAKLYPGDFRGSLPSIEEIERGLSPFPADAAAEGGGP
jgi:predicted nuclease of restriction endonuclease-like (RecB) superfamily